MYVGEARAADETICRLELTGGLEEVETTALLVDPQVSRSGGRGRGAAWLEPNSLCGGYGKETLQKLPPKPEG